MNGRGHPRRILVATSNRGKFREIAAMLAPLPVELVWLGELGPAPPVVEDGSTFAENAVKKARQYAVWSGLWTVGEDSGLEVDALAGAPGVHSARYAGRGRDDAANNVKLVAALSGVPLERRSARFRCAVVLASPDGDVLAQAEGVLEGRIVDEPRGQGGFGYDPHFFVPQLGCTTAELSPEQKNSISHRGRAFRAILPQIERLLQQCLEP
jgi:XTP/dITP diphosphohydrolase